MSGLSHSVKPPRVLVSYAWASNDHRQRVLQLANRLRVDGVDIRLDRFVAPPEDGWSRWMDEELEAADRVVIVCSPAYFERAAGVGPACEGLGVSWEWHRIRSEVYQSRGRGPRFVPVWFDPEDRAHLPRELWDRPGYELGQLEGPGYLALLDDLFRRPEVAPAALGTASARAPEAPELIGLMVDDLLAGRLSIITGPMCLRAAGFGLREALRDRLARELGLVAGQTRQVEQLASLFIDEQYQETQDQTEARARFGTLASEELSAIAASHGGSPGGLYERLRRLPLRSWFEENWAAPRTVRRRRITLHGELPGAPDQLLVTHADLTNDYLLRRPQQMQQLREELRGGIRLVCIGFSYEEALTLLYLRNLLAEVAPGQMLALLEGVNSDQALELRKRTGIAAVDLGRGEHEGATTERFLDAVFDRLQGGLATFTPPAPASPAQRPAPQPEAVPDLVEQPVYAFAGRRPGEPIPAPPPPPSHPLLDAIYVERGNRAALRTDLLRGAKTGICGLLGMGGVGKTYTAMKLAHEFAAEGWEVAWCTLLQQGTEDVLNQLADLYQLRFAPGLNTSGKAEGLRAVFAALAAERRKTLFVLDNAERFPDLALLLRVLEHHPVLITSRIRECPDIVAYHHMESMSLEQALEFSELLLTRHVPGRTFDGSDREDLARLAEFLGGHPLGIRLALSGFIRFSPLKQSQPRPFRQILEALDTGGISCLPRAADPNTGRAGETIHESVYRTFEWLFKQLPDEGEVGRDAALLLPLVAALGVADVGLKSLEEAVKRLTCEALLADLGLGEAAAPPDPERVVQLDWQRLVREGRIPDPEVAPSPYASAEYRDLVFGSLTLSWHEKLKIARRTGELTEYQVQELESILREERAKWAELADDQGKHQALAQSHRQCAAEAIIGEQAGWLDALGGLAQRLEASLDCLSRFGMIDAGTEAASVRIHPLVRQFSFEERNRDLPVDGWGIDSPWLRQSGPSMAAFFRCALEHLDKSDDAAQGDEIVDLVRRIGQFPELAAPCVSLVEKVRPYYYEVIGDWRALEILLEWGQRAAESAKLPDKAALFRAYRCELLSRMGNPSGLRLMRELVDEPEALGRLHDWHQAWLRAWLIAREDRELSADAFASFVDHYRERLATGAELKAEACLLEDAIVPRQADLRSYWFEGFFSAKGSDLSNLVLDLGDWLSKFEAFGLSAAEISRVEQLAERCEELRESSAKRRGWDMTGRRDILPGHRLGTRIAIASARALADSSLDTVQTFNDLKALARHSGIAETQVEYMHQLVLWKKAVSQANWLLAEQTAESLLSIARIWKGDSTEAEPMRARCYLLISRAVVFSDSLQTPEQLLRELGVVGDIAVRYARVNMHPWVLLAQAMVAQALARPEGEVLDHLQRARSAFERVEGAVPPTAIAIIDRALGLLNDTPRLEVVPVEPLCDWQLPETLASRVRCRSDGRTMRLVEAGFRPGANLRRTWFYPFYIDESPLDALTLERLDDLAGAISWTAREGLVLLNDAAHADLIAKRFGKRLPSWAEWCAAARAVAFSEPVCRFASCKEAREQHLRWIESAMENQVEHGQALPQHYSPTLVSDALVAFAEGQLEHPFTQAVLGAIRARVEYELRIEGYRALTMRFNFDLERPLPVPVKEPQQREETGDAERVARERLDDLVRECSGAEPSTIRARLLELGFQDVLMEWLDPALHPRMFTAGFGGVVLYGDPFEPTLWNSSLMKPLPTSASFGIRLVKPLRTRHDLEDLEPIA